MRPAAPSSTDVNWRAIGWAVWPFPYVSAANRLLTLFKITWVGASFLISGMLVLPGERRWWMVLGCSVVPVALLHGLSVYPMRVGVF